MTNPAAHTREQVQSRSLFDWLKLMLRESATYSLAVLAPRLLSFVMVPLYTRYLTPADYGVLELLELTMGFIGMVLWMRFGQAVLYFYFAAESAEQRDRISSTAFLWGSGGAMLFAAAAWLGSPALSQLVFGTRDYAHYFRIIAVTSSMGIPVEIGMTLLRAEGRSKLFSGLMVSRLILLAALNVIFLVIYRMGVSAMLWSALIGAVGLYLFFTWHVLAPIKIGFRKDLLLKMFRYAAPLGIGGLALFAVNYGDRYVLRLHVSLAEIGIYSLAYKLGMLIALIHQPFNTYWNAQMYAIMAGPQASILYVRVFTYLMFVMTYATLLVCLFARPLILAVVAPDYHSAAVLVPWIALAYLLRSMAAHAMNMFLIEKRPDLEGRISVITAAVCIGGYFLLIPPLGVWGAAISTVGAFAFMLVYAVLRAQRLRRFALEYGRMSQLAATGAALVFASEALRPASVLGQFATATFFALLFPTMLAATGFVDRDEWTWIRDRLQRLRARF